MSSRRRTLHWTAVICATLVAGGGCTSPEVPTAPVQPTRSAATPNEQLPSVVPTSKERIRAVPGDDLQALSEAAAPGATIILGEGVHREQSIIPKDGQRFVGELGAVLSGARVLDPAHFDQDERGRWFVDGQSQEGLVRGQVADGRPQAIKNPEEVFVNGNQRLEPTDRLADLASGRFHFDYDTDRIYLGDPPRTFDQIETSTTPFAFGGTGVRGVLIENLVVEKYASPVQFGAVGGSPPEQFTYDWTVRHVEARLNHGGGLGIGPGMVIEHADVHGNGQIGIVGHCEDQSVDPPAYRARVTVRDSRIHRNNTLGFRWRHEAGATKFKSCTAGFLFEGNWVHDNWGSGPWWDHNNYDATIRKNLVEGNDGVGIFYEISFGQTAITDNLVIGNGARAEGELAPGIFISNSEGVEVRRNVVASSRQGIYAISRADRDPLTTDLTIEGNTVVLEPGAVAGVAFDNERLVADIDIDDNRYDVEEGASAFVWGRATLDFLRWTAQGLDVDGEILGGPGPDLETMAQRLRRSDYGPVEGP